MLATAEPKKKRRMAQRGIKMDSNIPLTYKEAKAAGITRAILAVLKDRWVSRGNNSEEGYLRIVREWKRGQIDEIFFSPEEIQQATEGEGKGEDG